jgi:hypothetical protein
LARVLINMVNTQEKRENQTIVTAKRALGLSKMYLAIAIILGIAVVFFLDPTYLGAASTSNSISNNSTASSSNSIASTGHLKSAIVSSVALLAVPFSILPMLMLTTPMVILFVYDKNNGVLEYLLSLGMTQRQIYARYLTAALLIASLYILIFGALNIGYSYLTSGSQFTAELLLILTIGGIIAISTVAFMITMMMIFSVLQKSRAGGNQPLAITLGLVGVGPGYIIPFIFTFNTAIIVEIIQAAIIAGVTITLVASSGKLVKREKLLP